LLEDLQGKQGNDGVKEELLVVSNSSIIIALARICRLDLMEELFKRVIVLEAVWKEVAVKGKPGREKVLRAGFIHVERTGNNRLASFLEEFVDRGGAEAMVLALELDADLLLIDDRDARNLAKKLGLQVMGTLGVLALAKYTGSIREVKPIVNGLIESGFWISRKVLDEFLRGLGEL